MAVYSQVCPDGDTFLSEYYLATLRSNNIANPCNKESLKYTGFTT